MAFRMAAAAATVSSPKLGRKATTQFILSSFPCSTEAKSNHLLSFPRHRIASFPTDNFGMVVTADRGFTNYQIRAVSGATADPVTKKEDEQQSPENWRIKMLYDGDCPLCMREVDMLRERNKSYSTIKFVDISSDDYSPDENQGLDYKTVMGRIHAILSDGTVVTDVEAFRRLYEQVGLGWVYAVTKYEPIATMANAIYSVWAKYRLQITAMSNNKRTLVLGRPPLDAILEARMKNKGEVCLDNNSCKISQDP